MLDPLVVTQFNRANSRRLTSSKLTSYFSPISLLSIDSLRPDSLRSATMARLGVPDSLGDKIRDVSDGGPTSKYF